MAGRWEVVDQIIDGQDLHIGEPAFDSILHADFERAVAVATSTGAYLVLLTAPCTSSWRTAERPALAGGHALRGDSSTTRSCDRSPPNTRTTSRSTTSARKSAPVAPSRRPSTGSPSGSPTACTSREMPGGTVPVLPAAKWLAWKLFPEAVRVGRLQMTGTPLR